MFLNLLVDDQRTAFAALAEMMIESDGIIVGREAATMGALIGEMGLTEVPRMEDVSVTDLAAAFGDRRSKMVALLELVGLGYSDTSFSGTERSLVSEIAHEMGVGAQDLAQIEGWVQQHLEHIRSALVLMRE